MKAASARSGVGFRLSIDAATIRLAALLLGRRLRHAAAAPLAAAAIVGLARFVLAHETLLHFASPSYPPIAGLAH
jgi:hypothetical protein